jgi:hypothetical protein
MEGQKKERRSYERNAIHEGAPDDASAGAYYGTVYILY